MAGVLFSALAVDEPLEHKALQFGTRAYAQPPKQSSEMIFDRVLGEPESHRDRLRGLTVDRTMEHLLGPQIQVQLGREHRHGETKVCLATEDQKAKCDAALEDRMRFKLSGSMLDGLSASTLFDGVAGAVIEGVPVPVPTHS